MPKNAVQIDLDHISFLSGSIAAMENDDFIMFKSVYGKEKLTKEQTIEYMASGYMIKEEDLEEDSGLAMALSSKYANVISSMAFPVTAGEVPVMHPHGVNVGIDSSSGELLLIIRYNDDHDHGDLIERTEDGDFRFVAAPDSRGVMHYHILARSVVMERLDRTMQAEGLKFDVEEFLNSKPKIRLVKGDTQMSDTNTQVPLSSVEHAHYEGIKTDEERTQFKAMTHDERTQVMLKAEQAAKEAEQSKEEDENSTPEEGSKSEGDSKPEEGSKSDDSSKDGEWRSKFEESERQRKAESERVSSLLEKQENTELTAKVKAEMPNLKLTDEEGAAMLKAINGIEGDAMPAAIIQKLKAASNTIGLRVEGPSGAPSTASSKRAEDLGLKYKADVEDKIKQVKAEEIRPELEKSERFKGKEVKDFSVNAEFERNSKYDYLKELRDTLPES